MIPFYVNYLVSDEFSVRFVMWMREKADNNCRTELDESDAPIGAQR